MTDEKKSLEMLEGFQAHYDYDTSYMKEMLAANPEAFAIFEAFLPMASFIKSAPKELAYVAKLTSMKNEDCGACLQLNIDMAIEAGVSKDIIKAVVFEDGNGLDEDLKLMYEFTSVVVNKDNVDSNLYDRINKKYSKEIMTEIALIVASSKVFPAVKRVLNDFHSCSMITLEV